MNEAPDNGSGIDRDHCDVRLTVTRLVASQRRWLVGALLIGVVASLLPLSPARADFAQPGLNDAQLSVVHEEMPGFITNSAEAQITVDGKKFIPLDVAQLFQCKEGETDFPGKCMPIGLIATGPDGSFTTVVNTSYIFADRSGATVPCYTKTIQCVVAAATFDKTPAMAPTSRAEHRICWQNGGDCSWDPPTTTASTTTTTAPTTTTTLPPTTTTTTTTPPPPPSACTLREEANPHPPPSDPFPQPPETGNDSTANPDLVWKKESVAGPSPRESAAMAYDPTTGQTVLFGGFSPTAPCILGDTWNWDGDGWTRQDLANGPRPPARYGHSLAFDGEEIVLFGGYGDLDPRDDVERLGDFGDTWVWDGTKWTERVDLGDTPSPRARTAMAYDGARKQAVLFGGDHDDAVRDDTWTWDGRAWRLRVPDASPPPRGYAAMAYHPATQEVVLHGGWDDYALFDTWAWDGENWVLRHTGGLWAHSAAMAQHPATGLVVLQPGVAQVSSLTSAPSEYAGTTEWDGAGWANGGTPESPTTPPARRWPAMAEDALGHVVVFGGYGRESRGNVELGSFCPAVIADDFLGVGYNLTKDLREAFDESQYPCTPAVASPGSNAYRGDTWTLATPGTGASPSTDVRVSVTLNPSVVAANGTTKTTATASVTRAGAGVPGQNVTFSTDGDVTFAAARGTTGPKGLYTTTITASKTPDYETITATVIIDLPIFSGSPPFTPEYRGSAVLVEEGLVLTLDPASIPPDGSSTSVANVRLAQRGGLDTEKVCFSTDGDVTFSTPAPAHCGDRTGPHTWTVTITASTTGGEETITAIAANSKLRASAVLDEGGAQWQDRTAAEPGPTPARDNAAMAYDPAQKKSVLFGGFEDLGRCTRFTPVCDNRPLGDTWTWDGSHWAPVPTSAGPSPRWGHAMAYDASSGQVVLFGGFDGEKFLGDTWTFDVAMSTWTEQEPARAPSARYQANMAADGTGTVLFSGTDGFASDNFGPTPRTGPGHLDDTWTWRNGAWTFHEPRPVAPDASTAVPFTQREPIVVPLPAPPPGCPVPKGCPADKAAPYPSPLVVSDLSGTVADVTVTLNGLSYKGAEGGGLNDADIMVVAPDGTSVLVMSDVCGDGDTDPIILTFADDPQRPPLSDASCQSGTYRPTDVTDEEFTAHKPDAFSSPAPPTARSTSLASFRGIDPNGTWSLYVVDDGPNNPNPAGEAGSIGGGWSLKINTTATAAPARGTPPGRGRAAMSYHPPSGKVVLYGGSEEFQFAGSITGEPYSGSMNPLADTWTWDGTSWAQHGAGANPGPRHSSAMAYHPATGQLVLFGGSDDEGARVHQDLLGQTTESGDTWTWNGAAWAAQRQPIAPPARLSAAVAEDPSGRVVLFGGLRTPDPGGQASQLADTWTWDPRVSVRLDRPALAADGTSASLVSATVTDGTGRPVYGLRDVRFRTDGDAGITPATDRGDGTYVATVKASTTGGIETITVITTSGTASATLNVVGAACSPTSSSRPGGTWAAVAPMPQAATAVAAATGGDGRIYVFGGGRRQR